MKRLKNSGFVGVVAVFAAGVTALSAPPASAAERTLPGTSCVQGSIYTRATTTQIPTHYLYQGGHLYSRTFPSSGTTYKQNTWYSGLYASTGGGIQTPGSIQSASQGCAD